MTFKVNFIFTMTFRAIFPLKTSLTVFKTNILEG